MPTYDYRCRACDYEFEEFQSMSAEPLTRCPACSESSLERLIGTGAALIFKGSGFYETDYRSKSYREAAKKESASASGSAKDSGSSTTGGASSKETATSTGKPESASSGS